MITTTLIKNVYERDCKKLPIMKKNDNYNYNDLLLDDDIV